MPNFSNVAFTSTIQDMIDNPVMELRSDVTDISACVHTIDEQLRMTSEKLEAELTELRNENNKLRNQGYATLDQLDTLIHHQLTTLDSMIVGFRTCSQLSTNINNQLTTKIKRLTRLTALLGLLSIAAILFAILR